MTKTFLRLLAVVALASVGLPNLFAQRPVGVYGKAQIAGRDAVVHIWLVIPPGANANQVALDALASQGARPFQPGEFTTSGLVWDQFSDSANYNDFVTQNYNGANDPTGGGGEPALRSAQDTWKNVSTSRFAFQYGSTNRCPSLVRECPGPQTFDGKNDVAWLQLGGCCTLGVTWYSTSVDEADMALNTKFPWSTAGGNYDVETVFLHENGHVAGLGHTDVQPAVMYPYYQGIQRSLYQDDIDGITALYPQDGGGGQCTLGAPGDPCNSDSECCSGKCKGKPGDRHCR